MFPACPGPCPYPIGVNKPLYGANFVNPIASTAVKTTPTIPCNKYVLTIIKPVLNGFPRTWPSTFCGVFKPIAINPSAMV